MVLLKDNWRLPFSFRELWFYLNRNARFLNGLKLHNGKVFLNDNGILLVPGEAFSSSVAAWNVTGTGLSFTVTPGDIELGPDTVIAWGDITSASTTVTATTGDTVYWIWVNVDVENETATMLSGTSITALDSTEKKTICQKRIAKVTLADDLVTSIARYQCGNIFIPRL